MPALAMLGVGAALYIGWALYRGQDANWDLQNYHDYSAYALLTWRYPIDVGPGAFQAYFNPLPYVIPYGLRHLLPPRLAAVLLALMQAIVVPLAWAIARSLLPLGKERRVVVPVLAALVGTTGGMVLAEVGTSFADLTLAPLVLGGLLCLLQADAVEAGPRQTGRLLLSGALVGAAGGLKLTGIIFVPGLVAAALIARPDGWRGMIRVAKLVGAGGASGFLVTGGVWAVYLWATLGNPIFPGMNTLFRSSSAVVKSFQAVRFLPHSLIDALLYPWKVARGEHPTAENPFADSRMASALALSTAFAVLAMRRSNRLMSTLPMLRSICFLVVSYAVWLKLFAIERYIVALEVLAGTMAVVLATRLASSRTSVLSASAATALLVCTTRPAEWWHRPWKDAFVPILPAELQEPAAYVLVFHPEGYWASIFPAASRFYSVGLTGLATGGVLRDRLLAGLRHPPGGRIRTLGPDWPMDVSTRQRLASFGLVPATPCIRMRSFWWVDTIVCTAPRPGERTLAAADLGLGQMVDFSRSGSGWIYLLSGWINASADGVYMTGSNGTLVMDVGARTRPLILELAISSPVKTSISVTFTGRQTLSWIVGPVGHSASSQFCLPAGTARDGIMQMRLDVQIPAPLLLRSLQLRLPQPNECTG